jgi:hypothetical protein
MKSIIQKRPIDNRATDKTRIFNLTIKVRNLELRLQKIYSEYYGIPIFSEDQKPIRKVTKSPWIITHWNGIPWILEVEHRSFIRTILKIKEKEA